MQAAHTFLVAGAAAGAGAASGTLVDAAGLALGAAFFGAFFGEAALFLLTALAAALGAALALGCRATTGCQLGFSLSGPGLRAIGKCSAGLSRLSCERGGRKLTALLALVFFGAIGCSARSLP